MLHENKSLLTKVKVEEGLGTRLAWVRSSILILPSEKNVWLTVLTFDLLIKCNWFAVQ